MVALATLNMAPPEVFVAQLDGVFEHASWVAERTAALRPFATVAVLHDALMQTVQAAAPGEQIAFLRGHPELAGTSAAMAPLSVSEQASLDLAAVEGFAVLNSAYGERFGFPFILCIRRHSRASLLATFQRRLAADRASEHEAALAEIGFITRLRLVERVTGPGAPVVHGSLTTHVLDTAAGRPAAGIAVELSDESGVLARAVTDAEGRTRPLLSGAPLRMGGYELRFDITQHFRDGPAFLGVIPVCFVVTEPEAHYHVPLLVSPGGYTTYRGS